jgi:glutaredoxin 3
MNVSTGVTEMAKVEIYVSPFCGYCHRAKDLLAARGAAVTEIDVVANCERRQEMMARAGGRRTVPQIFIDGTHVGGCDDLYALDRQGKLKPMLESAT